MMFFYPSRVANFILQFAIDKKIKDLQYSESSTLTLLLKYNIYEELGALLSDDQTYYVLLNELVEALKSSPSMEKIIEVFELVNDITAAFSKRIQISYQASKFFE